MFWTIAVAVLFAAALITLSPLLRARSLWKPLALAMVFLLPAAAIGLYKEFGTPAALDMTRTPQRQAAANEAHTSGAAEMDSMIAGLRARLTESPESLDGWILLARTLKSTQRFPEALEALETANRIAPDNPTVMVDLVETRIFMTADGRITPDMVGTLQRALELQPGMQKALWLMGIASSQAGNEALAVEYWETLLEQVEPGSNVAQSVQNQINEARSRMGQTVETTPDEATAVEATPVAAQADGAWPGITVAVNADDASRSRIPSGGVLYVMIRSTGPAMGPPLGVRRIIDPVLPLEITISDQNSMMQERQISSETEVQLQARISLTGSPTAGPGDWQSLPVVVSLDSTESVELVINQKVE